MIQEVKRLKVVYSC